MMWRRLVRLRHARHKGVVLSRIVDLALPPRCPGCGATVVAQGRFCARCWGSLHFLGPPWCAACHRPFDHDRGEGALCGACLADPPRHAGVSAAVAYGAVARTLALRLKYAGRTAYADTAAQLMRRHLPPGAELLLPVPLHRRRLWWRGYNQAALIAAALSRLSGVPADARVLERHRATPPLRGHNPGERRRVVKGAFRVAAARRPLLRDKAVVLVDDVHTSGATADACVATLLAAGAASVAILAWTRVLDTSTD